MSYKRMHRPKVKIGNWNEDLVIEEVSLWFNYECFIHLLEAKKRSSLKVITLKQSDIMKEYFKKKEKGELLDQKVEFLKQNILQPVKLSVTNDGLLRFGDVVMLVNVEGENRQHSAVSINADVNGLTKTPSPGIQTPCGVSAGRGVQPCVRTAFIITSVDGSPHGSCLDFDQSFALRTTSGFARGLYLTSDLQSFQKSARKSGLQEVYLDDSTSFLSWWKIAHPDPQERLEYEGQPVPANEKVLVIHCKTNQALAVLGDKLLWTAYGTEYELTAHTFLETHKAEKDVNHWILCTSDPAGDTALFLRHMQPAAANQQLT